MTSALPVVLTLLICTTISLYTTITIRTLVYLWKYLGPVAHWQNPEWVRMGYKACVSFLVLGYNLTTTELPLPGLSRSTVIPVLAYVFLIVIGVLQLRMCGAPKGVARDLA